MNWKYPVTLAFFLGLLLTACKKESNTPNAASLKFVTAKQGDTLVLTGNNFNKDATVTLNGVEVTIVNATATELTIVIPDNATSGNVTVTVNGKVMEIGALTIVPLTLYCVKHDLYDTRNEKYQVIAINPEDGSGSELLDVTNINEFAYLNSLKYLPVTNELVGFNYGNHKLLKLNVATKQTTVLALTTGYDITYSNLILDKYGNLYAIRNGKTLIKIDPVTGKQTDVLLVEDDWGHLVYFSSSNEMIGLTNSNKSLLKVDLTTKDVSKIELISGDLVFYRELVAAGSELYGLKYDANKNIYKEYLVKIDPATGAQTIIKTLQDEEFFQSSWVYVQQRKAIYALHNGVDAHFWDIGICWYNIQNQKFTAASPFTTLHDIFYYDLTSN